MPARWSLPRVVNRLHRDVMAPLGFEGHGNRCTRADNGLLREMRFYTSRSGDPATKGIQVFLSVRIAGLPEPLVEFRRDALWTHLEPIRQLNEYPRPESEEPLPGELIDDVAGPGVSFLCHSADLHAFGQWATEVHAQQGSWGVFRHVYPGGTAPLQAAAFAAAVAGDKALANRTAGAVVVEEGNPREVRDFRSELGRVVPE
ncbi:hypothetical protein ACQPZK_23700 [Micromonospora sp. CA-249363]|uniref:hypothetical protein n=1 Tax=Micromonospora sp. CA-249363 TaxID=3239963 RepID=UPI003D946A5F